MLKVTGSMFLPVLFLVFQFQDPWVTVNEPDLFARFSEFLVFIIFMVLLLLSYRIIDKSFPSFKEWIDRIIDNNIKIKQLELELEQQAYNRIADELARLSERLHKLEKSAFKNLVDTK